jgi:hypothetical protein
MSRSSQVAIQTFLTVDRLSGLLDVHIVRSNRKRFTLYCLNHEAVRAVHSKVVSYIVNVKSMKPADAIIVLNEVIDHIFSIMAKDANLLFQRQNDFKKNVNDDSGTLKNMIVIDSVMTVLQRIYGQLLLRYEIDDEAIMKVAQLISLKGVQMSFFDYFDIDLDPYSIIAAHGD